MAPGATKPLVSSREAEEREKSPIFRKRPANSPYASPHTCGAMHAHFASLMRAMNGFAGRPLLPMIGQLAMQGFEVNVSGSVMSQQLMIPHA